MDQEYDLVLRTDGRLLGWASVQLLPGENEETFDMADVELVADEMKTEVKEPQEPKGASRSSVILSSIDTKLLVEGSSLQENGTIHGIEEDMSNEVFNAVTDLSQNVNLNQLSVFASLLQGHIERLKKPSHYGFKRVCYSKFVEGVPASDTGYINSLYYLSPPDSQGNQNKIRVRSELLKVLASYPDLTVKNFAMTRKIYRLGPEFEVVHETPTFWYEERMPDPGNDQLKSVYSNYVHLLEPGEGPGGMVACKLCPSKYDGRFVVRNEVSDHMRKFHLPDEECSKCGQEIRPTAKSIGQHERVCGGELSTFSPLHGVNPLPGVKYANEIKIKSRLVNCPICLKAMTKCNLSRHVRTIHPGHGLRNGELKESISIKTELSDLDKSEGKVSVSSSPSSDRGDERSITKSLEETKVSKKSKVREFQNGERGVAGKVASTVTVAFKMDGKKRVTMEARVGLKMMKLMKKFGRHSSHQLNELLFLQGGRILRGEEFVEDIPEEVVRVRRKT